MAGLASLDEASLRIADSVLLSMLLVGARMVCLEGTTSS